MIEPLADFLFLFATIDPISTLAIFLAVTATASEAERRRIALRAVAYSAAILVGFIVIGQVLLGSLGIRLASFQLAGGIVFFLFGLQMVFGSGAAVSGPAAEPGHDVAVFPLAVPSIAGPGGILAVVVLTDNRWHSIAAQAVTAGLLGIVLALTLVTLLQAKRIHGWIGTSGANLLVRVLGLVLCALAVEMVLEAAIELAADF